MTAIDQHPPSKQNRAYTKVVRSHHFDLKSDQIKSERIESDRVCGWVDEWNGELYTDFLLRLVVGIEVLGEDVEVHQGRTILLKFSCIYKPFVQKQVMLPVSTPTHH